MADEFECPDVGKEPTVEEVLAFVRAAYLPKINQELTDDEILGYGSSASFNKNASSS